MSQRRVFLFQLVLGILFVAFLQWISLNIGMTWDETTYLNYSGSIANWIKSGCDLDPTTTMQAFGYSDYLNPHPPLMKWFGALSMMGFSDELGNLQSYRLGHHVLVAVMIVAIAGSAFRSFGSETFAIGFLSFALLQPRLLGQLGLGTSDGIVAVSFLAACIAAFGIFSRGRVIFEDRLSLWFAILFGMAAKITGILVIIPLVLCLLIQRKTWPVLREVAFAFVLGLVLVVAIQPHLWFSPVTAVSDYLLYPIRRDGAVNISTFYFGVNYVSTLPWHYPYVMLLSVLPDWLIVGGVLSLPLFLKLNRRILPFIIFVGFWIILLALPKTPKHDEIRQFLPVCALLGGAIFLGCQSLYSLCSTTLLRAGALGTISLSILFTILGSLPWPTMYYNMISGGVMGNERKMNELCLYFEPLNKNALNELNRLLPIEAKLQIAPDWATILHAHQIMGGLRRDLWILSQEPRTFFLPQADYVLLFRRRTLIQDLDFFIPAQTAARRYYKGVEMMRLIKSDSAYLRIYHSINPELRSDVYSNKTRVYQRWNGQNMERKEVK